MLPTLRSVNAPRPPASTCLSCCPKQLINHDAYWTFAIVIWIFALILNRAVILASFKVLIEQSLQCDDELEEIHAQA